MIERHMKGGSTSAGGIQAGDVDNMPGAEANA